MFIIKIKYYLEFRVQRYKYLKKCAILTFYDFSPKNPPVFASFCHFHPHLLGFSPKNIPPKGVSFSDFICIFAMSYQSVAELRDKNE